MKKLKQLSDNNDSYLADDGFEHKGHAITMPSLNINTKIECLTPVGRTPEYSGIAPPF